MEVFCCIFALTCYVFLFPCARQNILVQNRLHLMGRYRVFMKRFELSEDFQAKLTMEQLRTQLSQFGITPEQMFEQMNSTLERMKAQIEQPPSS